MQDISPFARQDSQQELRSRCGEAKHTADAQLYILMQLMRRRDSSARSSARYSLGFDSPDAAARDSPARRASGSHDSPP
eukprot:7112838-Prymnesium_polylepis.1